MNLRLLCALGLAGILAHGDAFGGRPRHRRAATPKAPANSPAVVTQSAAAAAQAPVVSPVILPETVQAEDERFEKAKEAAKRDPQVMALKVEADRADEGDKSRQALEAYNRQLFQTIRQMDSSLAERTTLVETAVLKRIHED